MRELDITNEEDIYLRYQSKSIPNSCVSSKDLRTITNGGANTCISILALDKIITALIGLLKNLCTTSDFNDEDSVHRAREMGKSYN